MMSFGHEQGASVSRRSRPRSACRQLPVAFGEHPEAGVRYRCAPRHSALSGMR